MVASPTMNSMTCYSPALHQSVPMRTSRALVPVLVLLAHAAIFVLWSKHSEQPFMVNNELSVSFSIASPSPQPVVMQPRKIMPVAVSEPAPVIEPAPAEIAQQPAPVAIPAPVAAAVTPVVAATEPDYKAAYLNNPPPAYPLAARRMGMQGRVMLNVEVLANGVCGQINIHKSSGYAVLDNAALQTVKTWHFSPASQAGHAVDKWFMIPIQFSLKDNTA